MTNTDIAIVGAGLAGSTAAVMLGRAGHDVVLIDPDAAQRPEFRCEKLDASQLALLSQTGLADDVLPQTCLDRDVWVVRYGRLIDRRRGGRAGIMYHDLVNTIRLQIPGHIRQLQTKASAITSQDGNPLIKLVSGGDIAARLVVLATGLNHKPVAQLGIERTMLSRRHSVSIGFDLVPQGRSGFAFPALTYFPDNPDQLLAYLTLFPVPGAMRANLFVYWQPDDPRLAAFRSNPVDALNDYLPMLSRFAGPYTIAGRASIRPVDLVRADEPLRPGVVLVGDAYSTSCPAAGTGTNKVLTDVERLCSTYVPRWLGKPAIGESDIAAFYADPVKQACEQASYDKAMTLRQRSTGTSVGLSCWRGARFVVQTVIGGVRDLRRRLPADTTADMPGRAG